jgi:hypothetical protein
VTSVTGTVIWTENDSVGVEFATPMHGAVVMYLGFQADAGVTMEDLRNDQVDGALPSPSQEERKSDWRTRTALG